MRRTLVITVGFYAACSLGLGAVSQWLTSTAAEHTGLIQSFYTQTGSVDVAPVRRRVREIDLSLLEQFPDTLRRFFRVEWEGVWYVPENTTVDLDAAADDRVRVTVDGDLVIEYDITRNVDTGPRRLVLSRGFHDLAVSYEQDGGGYSLHVQWAPAGQALRPLTPETLFPITPDLARLEQAQRALAFRRVTRAFSVGLPVLVLLAFTVWWAVRAIARAVVPPDRSRLELLSPRVTTILASAALAIAAVVRFWGIDFGLPHTLSRPDEEFLIGMAHRFVVGQSDPNFFRYPPLYSYGLTVLYFGYYLWGFIMGVFEFPADMVATWHTQWEPFFLLSRVQSAALGTLTVLVIYRMGLRLFDRETALVAAFLLALAFLHARDSHFGTADVAMTLLTLLSVHLLIRAHLTSAGRDYVWAGIVGGLAMATKYNAALLLVPLMASCGLHVFESRGARGRAVCGRHVVLFALPFALVYLAAAPYTLLAFERFTDDVRVVQQGMQTGGGFADLGYGWAYHLTTTLRYGLGVPALVAALAGLIVAVSQDWKRTLLVCAFPIAYYCVAGNSRWVFVRYVLPVVPFLCLLAAVAIVWTGRRVGATQSLTRALVTIGLTIAVLFPSASSLFQLNRLLARTDSRVVAAQWVHAHVPAGSLILQNGGIYGRVQFDRTDHYREWRAREWIEFLTGGEPPVSNSSPPGRLDWIILHESPLGRVVEPSVAALVGQRYELVEFVKGSGSAHSANVFDLQDAFYVSYAGFRDVTRPGPDIRIYRNRD